MNKGVYPGLSPHSMTSNAAPACTSSRIRTALPSSAAVWSGARPFCMVLGSALSFNNPDTTSKRLRDRAICSGLYPASVRRSSLRFAPASAASNTRSQRTCLIASSSDATGDALSVLVIAALNLLSPMRGISRQISSTVCNCKSEFATSRISLPGTIIRGPHPAAARPCPKKPAHPARFFRRRARLSTLVPGSFRSTYGAECGGLRLLLGVVSKFLLDNCCVCAACFRGCSNRQQIEIVMARCHRAVQKGPLRGEIGSVGGVEGYHRYSRNGLQALVTCGRPILDSRLRASSCQRAEWRPLALRRLRPAVQWMLKVDSAADNCGR